jgi:hypothetical protein
LAVHYYKTHRRKFNRDGSIRDDYKRVQFRADERSVARICWASTQIVGMAIKGLLCLAVTRNPNPF